MRPAFDPYHQWLGIRPEEHPVDHYRLLGIVRFESDRDVIANACDRLMSHVRTFQTGPRGVYTQEVLTRLAAARACLLDVHAKSTYDAVLHGQQAAAAKSRAQAPQQPAMANVYEPATAVLPPPPPTTSHALEAPPIHFAQTAASPMGRSTSPPRLRASDDVEYVEKSTPFYFHTWFALLMVAGLLLAGLMVWGIGSMVGQARKQAAERPVENNLEVDVPLPLDNADEPPDDTIYIRQEAGGELNFTAGTAAVAGNARLGEIGGQSVIGDITSSDDRVTWAFRVEQPGPFRIEATYSAPPGSEGGTFQLAVDDEPTKPIAVRNTGAAGEFTSERVGFLWIKRSGKHELRLVPLAINDGHSLMTLRSLRLVPVKGSAAD
jgi:hypothetical protein